MGRSPSAAVRPHDDRRRLGRTDVRLCAARLATRGLRRGAAASESAAPCKMCYLFARCGAAPSQFECIVFCSCLVCTFAAGWFVSSFVALNRRHSIGLARFALPYSCQRLRELSCLLFSTLCFAAADPVLCPTSQNHYDLGRSVRCGQRMPTLAVSMPRPTSHIKPLVQGLNKKLLFVGVFLCCRRSFRLLYCPGFATCLRQPGPWCSAGQLFVDFRLMLDHNKQVVLKCLEFLSRG